MDRDELRQRILNVLSDLAVNFWAGGYKGDEQLSREKLEEAVKDGVISIDEMAQTFRDKLLEFKRADI